MCSVLQENPTSSIDLVCKMEEIENINPVLADLVMEAGYCAIDKLYSKVVSMWLILYSRKIWWGIKFGGLVGYVTTTKLKSAKISYSHIIRMVILYRTGKFKSANILAIALLGSTAKFNFHQYFQLYGTINSEFLNMIYTTAASAFWA